MSWWHSYWAWTGGNIGAMPLEFAITLAVTLIFLKPLKWAWRKLTGGDNRLDAADLKRAAGNAEKALRIAADLFEHHTGEVHPEAPAKPESEAL